MSQDYSAFKAATRPGKVDPSVDSGYAPYTRPTKEYPTVSTEDIPPLVLPPKIPAATARRLSALSEIPPMVPAKTYARLDDAALEGYTSRPKPMLPAKTMARYLGLLDPPVVVEESVVEEPEKPKPGLRRKMVEGLKGALPQAGITAMDVVGLPLKASVMFENTFLPGSNYQENGLKILTEAQDSLRKYLPQVEEGLTFGQQLRDPRIVIPSVVDFGTQILMMGGLGGVGKNVGQKLLLSPKAQEALAIGVSSFYAGHIEGTHTYFEALKRGKSNGEALAAYAMQTVGSGVVSIPEGVFLFSKLPGPFQQGLVRRLSAGTVNGLTEAVDEVISDMALSGEVDAARALAVYKDSYAKIGTAAMLVGLITGGAGIPPELVHRAPTPGEVGANVDLTQVDVQNTERDKFTRERMASVLNMEADFFDTVDGQRIAVAGGGVRGGVVEGDSDSYWVSGVYNAKEGVSIPVSRIAQVGRYDDQGNEVILATSEGQQQVYAKMEEMERTVFPGPSQFQARSMTHDEAVAERYDRIMRLRTDEFDRSIDGQEVPTLRDMRRSRPRAGEGIEGLEAAVKGGISSGPERQAVEVPVETSDKMFSQVEKLEAETGRKKKPESIDEAQQNKRRTAGLKGSVTAIQNQVKANIEPIADEGVASDLEQMAARAATGQRVSTMDEVIAAEEEVRRMDRRLKAQTSTVVDERGNAFPIRPQLMTHVAKGAKAPARAFSGETMVDVQAEVLRMVGSEDAMSALRRGDISAEDVMMRATETAGLLKFEKVEGSSALKATRVEGQNSLDYQAAISLYVTNARRLKNLVYYMRETEAMREQGVESDRNPTTAGVKAPSAAETGQRAMFQTKKSRREALNRKTVDEPARYMAAIRHSGLYHEILRAGQTAKWNNPFEVAETVSEFTFARATAWAAQKRGRTQQQFYDEFIREVRAYAREMTESQYDVFRATQGFAVPKEMLFQSDDRTAAQKVADFFRRRKPEAELSAGDLRRAHNIVYDRMHLVEILRGLEPSLQSEGQQIARDLEAKFREFAARPSESLRLEEIEAAVQEARAKTFELEGKVLFSKEEDAEAEARANKSFSPPTMFSKQDRQILGSYDPRTHSVEFFLGSDMHTVIHEFGHAFRQSLSESENKALEKFIYAGRKRPKDGRWDTKAEEKFADAFLVWAGSANLDAVPPELRGTFSHIGYYLTNLYSTGRALKPGTKVNPELARVMERLITSQLTTSADADDREEGKRRERIRREFLRSKPLVNLGDHVEAIAEVLGIDKASVTQSPMLREEMAKRTANKSYMDELAQKLKQMEKDNLVSIDIVDFMIVRDRAIEIREQFEREFREAYNQGDAAVVALAEKWHKRKAHNDIKHYLTVAGDAGRRLNLLSNKAIGIDFALVLDETQKKYGAKGFDILHSMLKDPENAYAIANEKAAENAPGIFDLYMQAFYGGMLSSPKTLAVNTVFTGLWTAMQYSVHTPLAAAVDRTMWSTRRLPAIGRLVDAFYFSGDTRSRDEVVMSMGPLYSQLRDSVPLGFKEAAAILKDPSFGLNPFDTLKGMDIVAKDIDSWQRYTLLRSTRISRTLAAVLGRDKGEAARQKITDTVRRLGPVVSIATNSMRASDMFFKVIAAEGAINKRLQIEAAQVHPNNKKLQREYVFEQTKKYSRNMHSMPVAWQEEIIKAASYNTFMDLPGAASRHIIAARETVPLIKLVLPFFNTLVNIGKRGLEMTPGIGLVAEAAWTTDKSFTRGQYGHTNADIIAKQIEGSVMAALVFMFLDDDRLTGEMPEDPKERAYFLQSGKLPYSIRMGDTWVSYEFADPFAIPLKIVANLRQYVGRALKNSGDPNPEVQKKVTQDLTTAGWAIGSIALNVPFMRTYHDYVEANTEKSKLRALGRTTESALVPFSGLLRWMQRKANMMRNEEGYFVPQEENTLVDSSLPLTHNVINKMFGLPSTDVPRLTVWGEPYTYSDNKWWEIWWPVNYSEASADEVDAEIERLGAGIGMPSRFYERRGTRYLFAPEIHQQLVLGFGRDSKPMIRELISTPGYAELPDTSKVVAIKKVVDKVRERHRRLAQSAQLKLGETPV